MKVLITCGPTWVALDDMRVISNQSTGAMGHLIAHEFHKSGAKVTLVEGPVTSGLEVPGIRTIKYTFFDELSKILKRECARNYNVIIHAAAVSDFKPAKASKTKIDSGKPLVLNLKPTPKLIDTIKKQAPNSFLVGFKLVSRLKKPNVFDVSRLLFSQSGCDLVVANTIKNGYEGYIVDGDGNILASASQKKQIAQSLVRILN